MRRLPACVQRAMRRRIGYSPGQLTPHRRSRIPHTARQPSSHAFTRSAELNAMIERVAPDILALLADGIPRTKPAIVEALAGRHDKQDVVHALIRLAVTGQVEDTGGKYTLGAAGERSCTASRGTSTGDDKRHDVAGNS